MSQTKTSEVETGVECAICGRLNPADVAGCQKCGARLYLSCRHCGTRNERIRRHCEACHRRLHRSWWVRRDGKYFKYLTPFQTLLCVTIFVLLVCLLVQTFAPSPVQRPPGGGAVSVPEGDGSGVTFGGR